MNMFLKKRMEAKKNKKKGFTLIEVIVVIVIIAILAAIAVPSLTRYIGQAGLRADMAMGHNIQVVLQAELSDMFIDTISWNGGTAQYVGDADTLLGSSVRTPITVRLVLSNSGVIMDTSTTLALVSINPGTGQLLGFSYRTATSNVNFGPNGLVQILPDQAGFVAP